MARIDDLRPDQRATLQLLLQQGRSYDEIAQMLRIERRAVRERARAGLDVLGPEDPEGLELAEQDDVADYLLGQQSASRRAQTRELLSRSAPARAWARVVASELRPLAGDGLPDIPAEAAEVDEAFDALNARKEHREHVQRSSRRGGILLLAGLAALLAVLIVLVVRSGDDDPEPAANTGRTSTQAAPAGEAFAAQANLEPVQGFARNAEGAVIVTRQGDQAAVALALQGMPEPRGINYGVWLRSGEAAQPAVFLRPQDVRNGRAQGELPLRFDPSAATEVIVTRENDENVQRPGRVLMRGQLQRAQNPPGGAAPGGAGGAGGGTQGQGE